jgi:hypothetical protein
MHSVDVPGVVTTRIAHVTVANVKLHVHNCSGRNRIIPLMRRPNTDSTPNKPVTLPRNQLLIRYAVTSPVHTVTIRCYGTVKRLSKEMRCVAETNLSQLNKQK